MPAPKAEEGRGPAPGGERSSTITRKQVDQPKTGTMGARHVVVGQAVSAEKLQRARELRRELTPAERVLWSRLRAGRLDGLRFRRQQVIDGYIADFYCHAAPLVVEVDGPVHAEQSDYDAARDRALTARGLQILRLSNATITTDLPAALAEIRAAVGRTSPPAPPRRGEGSVGRQRRE
jgi:very-short-patch-repair endonuclease